MLLINPAVHPQSQPQVFKPFVTSSFPTALGYLATYIREKHKAKVTIYDEQMGWLTETQLKKEVERIEGPKIVGITCMTTMAKRAYDLTHLLKKIDPEIEVLLGGIHPTAVPEECLTKSSADIVVRGEGEETLSEIYAAVKEKKDFNKMLGVSYKHDGNIVHNPLRAIITDLEKIPPFPYDLFEYNIDRYKDFGTIISSRGCPFNCIFCSQRIISGQTYRFLPEYRVINKIKLLVDKYHQTKIIFDDDSFTVNRKRTFALLDEIISSGYHKKANFYVTSRGKEITWELLLKMKEANIVSIAYGLETGSERLMTTIKKGETVEDNIIAVKLTHKAGIAIDSSMIMGLPTETKEDRKLSVKLALKLPLDGNRFNIAVPYPGTKFYEIAKQEGRLNMKDDWINFNNQHYLVSDEIPYTPNGTSASELIYDIFIANMRYTLMPKALSTILFSRRSTGGQVFSFKKYWYVSAKMWYALIKLALFIIKRGCIILIKGRIIAKFRSLG